MSTLITLRSVIKPKNTQLVRRLASNKSLLEVPKQQEVKIPVPWGHLAAKQWGNPKGFPVICLHGWLDNACSFDGLAPILPNEQFNFVAVDLPGHGFSSHFPAGMTYRFSDSFTAIRYVKEHFDFEKFTLIGHSMGAAVAIWYASIFSDEVNKLISLDLVNVGPITLEKHVKRAKSSILTGVDTFKKLHGRKVPTYDYIDAVARAFMANQFAHGQDSITQESVETLMKRGLIEVGDKVTWSADLRLRIPATFNALEEQVEHYATNIICPLLLLKASGSHWYMQEEIAKRIIKVYKNHNPNFEMEKIEGGHHVHLNEPEKVISHINDFLLKTDFQIEDETKKDKQDNINMDLF